MMNEHGNKLGLNLSDKRAFILWEIEYLRFENGASITTQPIKFKFVIGINISLNRIMHLDSAHAHDSDINHFNQPTVIIYWKRKYSQVFTA